MQIYYQNFICFPKCVRDEETMCKEQRKTLRAAMAAWNLKSGWFSINYEVILWEEVQMRTLEKINSSEWKAMKENQECTSGDYSHSKPGNTHAQSPPI